jgi:hypothetical protein
MRWKKFVMQVREVKEFLVLVVLPKPGVPEEVRTATRTRYH